MPSLAPRASFFRRVWAVLRGVPERWAKSRLDAGRFVERRAYVATICSLMNCSAASSGQKRPWSKADIADVAQQIAMDDGRYWAFLCQQIECARRLARDLSC